PLTNKYAATLLAVGSGLAVALLPGPTGAPGTGGLILWPLFGATNQLLAGLALMVTSFYLWRRNRPVLVTAIPMVVMMIMPAWAMLWNLFNAESGWWIKGDWLLSGFGVAILALQAWMLWEGWRAWPQAKGVLESSSSGLCPE
ncbi:MAG: carbon starvation protein A, partial [Planctomycetales bacterium]|nr:carbon starvation protein A [Planctomycetales bacterium]